MLRLLRLDDDRRGLLPRDDGRSLLLLRRVDGPLVAGHAEGDETARPDAADAQDPGDTKRDDPNEFLPHGPGVRRRLDHDGGRLLLLVHHLSDRLHGLLRLIHDLPHGLDGLNRGLDDRHGRGLHDLSLRLHDGALCHGGGLGARDVARGHGFALALHGRRRRGCPSKREGKRDAMCRHTPVKTKSVVQGGPPCTETELSTMRAYLWLHIGPRDVLVGQKDSFFLLVPYRPASSQPRRKRRAHTELDSSTGLGLGLSTIPRIAPATMPHEQAPSR